MTMARAASKPTTKPLDAWLRLPTDIENAIRGLGEPELDGISGSHGWTARETVHHLVEANLIAANIVISAMSRNERPYDWSWVNPDKEWMQRLGYDRAPITPALDLLRALGAHVATLLTTTPMGLKRQVQLLDAPGATPYAKTVEEILKDEVEHAREHLLDVKKARGR